MGKSNKKIYETSCIKSFAFYYIIASCLAFLIGYAVKASLNHEFIWREFLMALSLCTGVAIVTCIIFQFRHVELSEERITVKWSFLQKKHSIPLCLIDSCKKGNFLASPAVKIRLKNGRTEKILFVDDAQALSERILEQKSHKSHSVAS